MTLKKTKKQIDSNQKKSNQKDSDLQLETSLKDFMEAFRKEVNALNYEESLQRLDEILTQLQSNSLSVEDLQRNYLKGRIYLEHCSVLLSRIESEVEELDWDINELDIDI